MSMNNNENNIFPELKIFESKMFPFYAVLYVVLSIAALFWINSYVDNIVIVLMIYMIVSEIPNIITGLLYINKNPSENIIVLKFFCDASIPVIWFSPIIFGMYDSIVNVRYISWELLLFLPFIGIGIYVLYEIIMKYKLLSKGFKNKF